ncbi:MAG: hypothetical protein H5U36_08110 [Candidatus Caldatribacterium sp.]|nr:hypothetical protein [Candidatus Caldatribacterium sp.]
MLLEVVITVFIMAFILTLLYQFLGSMNKRGRAQIADQEIINRINLFLNAIAKDFRSAGVVAITVNDNSTEVYIETTDGRQNTYIFKDNEILKNDVPIVQGITESKVECEKSVFGGKRAYTKLTVKLSTPSGRSYSASILRRNPPKGNEWEEE